MRKFTVLGLLMLAFSVSAFGQVIDPNVAICAPVASSACGGDPNSISGTTFGMFPIGGNSSGTTWYLLVAVPQTTAGTITPPAISSTSFTLTFTSQKEFTSSSTGDIYDLFTQTSGDDASKSLNVSNLFGSSEQAAFGGTPNDFEVLLYTATGAFTGNTAYSFTVSPGLAAGTFVGVGATNGQVSFATPFTTAGLVGGPVPDGGMTLMLLGGALVGLEALRRRVRA